MDLKENKGMQGEGRKMERGGNGRKRKGEEREGNLSGLRLSYS